MSVSNCIIDFLLANAQYHDAVFQEDTLNGLEPEARQYLIDAGMLVRTGKLASHVYEDGEPVKIQVMYGSDPQRHFFIDGGDFIDVPLARLELISIDYGQLARISQRDFMAKNKVKELIAGRLWFCGNTGRQQREVFLARNAGTDANVTAFLKGQPKRSVVLQIGVSDEEIDTYFTESHVCQIRDILSWGEGGLTLDKSVIKARIDDVLDKEEATQRSRGKKYLENMEKMKVIFLEAFLFYLTNARRTRYGESYIPMPPSNKRVKRDKHRFENFHDQHSLSVTSGIAESTITAIKHEWQQYSKENHNATFLALMDFLMSKRTKDSQSVFEFYRIWKNDLQAVGFQDIN